MIAIGASAGGTFAVKEIIDNLPEDFPVPIVVVQHIPLSFVPTFISWLNGHSSLNVQGCELAMELKPGNVYVPLCDGHIVMNSPRSISFEKKTPKDSFVPSIGTFISSVVNKCRKNAIGILLSGMGDDGSKELAALKAIGGVTLVQDKGTSVVFGMAKKAIEMDGTNYILPIHEIPHKLLDIIKKK